MKLLSDTTYDEYLSTFLLDLLHLVEMMCEYELNSSNHFDETHQYYNIIESVLSGYL